MFNLKRKSKESVQSVKQSFEPIRNPQDVIAEIHNEFDTATDKLLAEAKEILSAIKDVNKGERLKSLGFHNSKPAVEAKDEIAKRDKNKKIAECVEYFSINYPNQKFITEEKVAEICKKYRLVFGLANFYSGDVPDKNIKEIESFKLKEEDMFVYRVLEGSRDDGSKFKGYYKTDMYGRNNWVNLNGTDCGSEIKEQLPFKICAPISDFDQYYIKNYTRVEDGYNLVANIQDPIVLQPVNGGYLIVSKWGLEGEDKDLVNEKMN